MFTQSRKLLLANVFICWRIFAIFDGPNQNEFFSSLWSFRNKLNIIEPFHDFFNQTCVELFSYEDKIDPLEGNSAA